MNSRIKYILVHFVLLLVFSCKAGSYEGQLTSRIEGNLGLDEYSVVIIIPGAGCSGCISQAEAFFRNNMKKKDHLFVFTNIASMKTLRIKMEGIDINNMPNVILDYDNSFYINNDSENIYPHIVIINNGHVKEISRL